MIHVSEEEFLKKIKELDPFLPKAATYNILYEHFETCVAEMERLEDIEDDRVQMKLCIEGLEEKINELKKSH